MPEPDAPTVTVPEWRHGRRRHRLSRDPAAAARVCRHRHPPGLERGPVARDTRRAVHASTPIRGRVIEIEGPVEFGAFGAKANARFAFYEYIPLNFVVTIGSDNTARGRSYSLEVAEDRESGEWVEFYGTYQDEYAVYEGSWRFAGRHYQTYGRRTDGRLTSFPLDTAS